MKILIYGLGKSGTTILLYKIKSALDRTKDLRDPILIFEPSGYNQENHHFNIPGKDDQKVSEQMLCKALMPNIHNPGFSHKDALALPFEKKIFITRDPRDRWLSSFFYKWHRFASDDPKVFENTIERLKIKENKPSLFPMFVLNGFSIEEQQKLIDDQSRLTTEPILFSQKLDDSWMAFKYEDLIDGSFQKLNDFLGLDVNDGEVGDNLKRVVRSKSYGNWRNWFTQEDVDFFKPIMNPYLKELGYDHKDWKLNNPQQIDSALGSDYILNLAGHVLPKKNLLSSYISKFKK